MLTLWLALLSLFILPACAALGGVCTWLLVRGQRPDEGTLLRHFIVCTTMFVLVSMAVPRTDWFRNRYDPVTKAHNALGALPVQAALRQHKEFEWKRLQEKFDQAIAAQVPLPQVVSAARTEHLRLARYYLPWSPGRTILRYGQALVPALRELNASDPALCVRLAWPSAGPAFDTGGRLSAPVAAELEAAIAEVIARSDQSYGASAQWEKDDPASGPFPLDQLQLGYRAIREELESRHGDIVGRLHTRDIRQLDPVQACPATIDLFTRALQQEPRMARSLLGNMLRS